MRGKRPTQDQMTTGKVIQEVLLGYFQDIRQTPAEQTALNQSRQDVAKDDLPPAVLEIGKIAAMRTDVQITRSAYISLLSGNDIFDDSISATAEREKDYRMNANHATQMEIDFVAVAQLMQQRKDDIIALVNDDANDATWTHTRQALTDQGVDNTEHPFVTALQAGTIAEDYLVYKERTELEWLASLASNQIGLAQDNIKSVKFHITSEGASARQQKLIDASENYIQIWTNYFNPEKAYQPVRDEVLAENARELTLQNSDKSFDSWGPQRELDHREFTLGGW